ncbi:hypothetical protein [Salegentibacter maritimus]|uniref:Uncharacterized protein n=1 Tax=Salegentibacter maritimus TaxID=2794347 RepID=A0ABS0TJ20_9FLAO|nr:hypothetical protein [Salegentibacter maritimus]MBI6121065.1 hypothetical protein [Salegentibacter maritimus]
MKNKKYLKDLSDIKFMMSRSSRFGSLSGLAGVFAGIYALIGAVIAQVLLWKHQAVFASLSPHPIDSQVLTQLFFIALAVLVLAIGTAILLSIKKAKKLSENAWNSTSKRLLINFFVPLTVGGLFCLVLLQYSLIGLIAPVMLIFYGLALIHADKYAAIDIKSLGYIQTILGLIATQFLSYGLYFWATGFGLFHIVYGIWVYKKYDRKNAE